MKQAVPGFNLDGFLKKAESKALAEQSEESTVKQEAVELGQLLFKRQSEAAAFSGQLLRIYRQAYGKDLIIIHNPGGWGGADLKHLIKWEESVISGVKLSLKLLGRRWLLVQYFRAGNHFFNHIIELPEQLRFSFTGRMRRADVLTEEIKFLLRNTKDIDVLLLGVSQGAAFSNAIMRQMDDITRVYSIELGIFFPHVRRRIITEHTLALDNNGIMPDPIVHVRLGPTVKAYIGAPFRWIKYLIEGKHRRFSMCINVPGHEYRWDHASVREPIIKFLTTKLGSNRLTLEKKK